MGLGVELAGARVLVTGGSGLIGSHVVDRLVAAGAERVVVLDREVRSENLEGALESGRVETVEGDLRDSAAVEQALQGTDAVVHLAALLMSAGRARMRDAVEVNILASYDLIERALDAGARRFVLGSTVGVYGQPEGAGRVDERAPINARSAYGASKFAVELICRAFADERGLDYVALRLGTTYGARMSRRGLFPRHFFDALEAADAGRVPRLPGDPAEVHDFLYVDDAAEAIELALAADVTDTAITIASGESHTIGEIYTTLLDVYGAPTEIEWVPREYVFATDRRWDVSRARETLDWTARTSLRDGLRRFVEWRAQEADAETAGTA